LQPKSVLLACDVTLGEIVGHLVHRLRLQESVSHGVWIRIFGTHGSHRFDRDLWERVMRITNPWLVVLLLAASVIGPAIVFYVVIYVATRPNRAILLVLIFMTMPFTVIGSQMAVFYSLQRWLSNYGDFESIVFARGTFLGNCLYWVFKTACSAAIIEFVFFVAVIIPASVLMVIWPALIYLWPLLVVALAVCLVLFGWEALRTRRRNP
jgi:hypothetical protein